MRILLVSSIFPPRAGGVAVVYHHICSNLSGDISAIAPQFGSPSVNEYDRAQQFSIARSYGLRKWSWVKGPKLFRIGLRLLFEKFVLKLVCSWTLLHSLVRFRPEVVCIGTLDLHWMMSWIRRFSRARVVFYIHGEEISYSPSMGPLSRYFYRREVTSLQNADGVIGVSKYTTSRLRELGVEPGRVRLIYNGVDTERFTPGDPNPQITQRHQLDGKSVLLTVARLDARKGHATVLRALPEVLKVVKRAVYLIVGEGPQRAALEKLAEELLLQPHVIFAGKVNNEELCDYYRACDLFVQPNRQMPDDDTEGFGLVFLEAGACGKPVIGGRAGGVPEAVADGETGILVDGDSVAETSEALIKMISNHQFRMKLGQNGLTRAKQFSWQATANQFHQFCSELARQPFRKVKLIPHSAGAAEGGCSVDNCVHK